jgi:hypothetical protein
VLLGGVLVVGGSTALIVLAARTHTPQAGPPVPPPADHGAESPAAPEPPERPTEESST